jgi:predicted metal-binding protein
MTTWITICDTCKRDDWDARGVETTDGERLAEMVEAAAQGNDTVKTRRHSCLMGCTHGCNVVVQGQGKLNYTIGNFDPSEEAAGAIVDYAALHAQSETGTVPYRQWPQPIKGHFVSRHPPLPDDES